MAGVVHLARKPIKFARGLGDLRAHLEARNFCEVMRERVRAALAGARHHHELLWRAHFLSGCGREEPYEGDDGVAAAHFFPVL